MKIIELFKFKKYLFIILRLKNESYKKLKPLLLSVDQVFGQVPQISSLCSKQNLFRMTNDF